MSIARKLDEQRYHQTYSQLEAPLDECYYCLRDYGLSVDHVPPISYAHLVDSDNRILVPACGECNSSLSNNGLTIRDRAELLLARYQKKYRKYLELPHWEREEMRELGYRMRKHIENGLAIKTEIQLRLDRLRFILDHPEML